MYRPICVNREVPATVAHILEYLIVEPGKVLVAEIRINRHLLGDVILL
jgi:hypothetical protein